MSLLDNRRYRNICEHAALRAIALCPGCVLYLSLLAMKVVKSHCRGEVLNSAADAILTHSARSIAHAAVRVRTYTLFFLVVD